MVFDTFSFCVSSRRRHTSFSRDWSSDVCSSDLGRVDLDCLRYLLLLLCGEAADLCLEIAFLDSRRAQGRVEILADLTGPLRDAANVLDVSLVLRVLPAGRTA